jgi:hypothetical protein
VVADGFSCKTQIEQLTDRRALHTAQVIKMALDEGPRGPATPHPEDRYPDAELPPDRRSALGLAGVGAAVAGAAAIAYARRR